ncbi:uncharacterized protein BYT42DRAFT_287533 [Radiomyces spectabilis]|uniref:uncharacterized protein n=1 Tax=Radiomyces spectabilis TaxID=64574 RepID=UPI00221EE6F3|nr:uncharacterized protein BYT42DRAFT_287533 [Radiomyces spectabilis]KAI8380979.1 hypothetical protein BYT42DRAFT_287533 [Radiomyces spectabilis]
MDPGQTLYQKALRSFLLTKYTTAASTCYKAVQSLPPKEADSDKDTEDLRLAIWTLYLNIATTLLTQTQLTPHITKLFGLAPTAAQSNEHFGHALWTMVAQMYGDAGHVDPRLVSACLVMALKLDIPSVGRQIAEQWYASMPDTTMDHLAFVQADPDSFFEAYIDTIHLYVTRILPLLRDFESATTFVEFNSFLSDEKKEHLQQLIKECQHTEERDRQKKLEAEQKAAIEAKQRAEAEEQRRKEAEAERLATEAAAAAHKAGKPNAENSEMASKNEAMERRLSNATTSAPSTSSTNNVTLPPQQTIHLSRKSSSPDRSLTIIKAWFQQLFRNGSMGYIAILIAVFALVGMLRGQRSPISQAAKAIFTKLWQTVRMGTKVTYM